MTNLGRSRDYPMEKFFGLEVLGGKSIPLRFPYAVLAKEKFFGKTSPDALRESFTATDFKACVPAESRAPKRKGIFYFILPPFIAFT